MKFDFSSRVADAQVDFARSLDAHLLLREMGADVEGRAGTPLALRAMTDGSDPWLAGYLRAQRPGATTSDPRRHRKPPFSASAWHTNVQDGSRLTALG